VPSAGKKCLTIKSTGIAVDENDSIVSFFSYKDVSTYIIIIEKGNNRFIDNTMYKNKDVRFFCLSS
jgi:hypothetical protein